MTKATIKMTLEAARRNAGYSQKEAAKLLGVHPQTLASWEKNSSKLSYIEAHKLGKLYKVEPDLLFFGRKNEFIRSIRNEED